MARVGLLVCGHIDATAQPLHGDYPDLFGALLRDHPIEFVRYDLAAGRFPDSERECDGWLCSPSRASVYDEQPWIADAEALHRRIVEREVPYVGICFGHQLLAQALGGRVGRAPDGWNVGVHEYVIDRPQAFMAGDERRVSLIASHEDQVVAAPDDAIVFARAGDGSCPVGGMAFGERAWTIQLHPEFVPALADDLLAERVELIGAEKVERARATLTVEALGARPLSNATVASWIARTLQTQVRR